MPSRSVSAVFLAAFFVVGCSSDPAPSTSNTDAGKDTGGALDSAIAPCSEPAEERPAGGTCVKTVTGKVVDTTGAPVGDKLVSVCGSICFFGETKADGTFTTEVGKHIVLGDFAASVHGRPGHASLYEKLPAMGGENITLPNTLVLPIVPATGAAIPLNAERIVETTVTVEHNGVALGFTAGTEVELDLEDIELIGKPTPGDHLRAVRVEEKDYPTFAKGADIKLLYALTPFDARFSKKVGIAIKDTAGLPEGTAVEFVALGNEFLKAPFTAGKLEVVAVGAVKGSWVMGDPGEGLSTLTWIGVRAKK